MTFNLLVGQTIGVHAIPKAADGSVVANNGNAASTGSNDAIAKITNSSGDGLTVNITGVAIGSANFTVVGHDVTTNNPVSSTFDVVVATVPLPALDHFDFVQVTPI